MLHLNNCDASTMLFYPWLFCRGGNAEVTRSPGSSVRLEKRGKCSLRLRLRRISGKRKEMRQGRFIVPLALGYDANCRNRGTRPNG
jgi:hypothetical protein